MVIPLYGYFEGDFLGLVIVALTDQKVSDLAEQLAAWVLDLRVERTGASLRVFNESGDPLDSDATLEQAGFCAGDIFSVRQAA